MLVLTRRNGERLHIGDNVTVTVTRIQGNKVRLGIEAPADVSIRREEIPAAITFKGDRDFVGSGFECVLPR